MGLDLSLSRNSDGFYDLEKYVKAAKFDLDIITKAYHFGANAHENKYRESGVPYIAHLAWVAKVVAQLNIGQEAVIAALLHDTVEETPVTIDQIADEFGDEVALLVAGLTEVKKKTQDISIHQTSIEVFRRFLFSSVNDVRVLIIRLVDKLHNGLTIDPLPDEKKMRYAKKVMGIYGPIAEYVGLHYFKRLLEDIAFKILYPEEAAVIEKMFHEQANDEIKALALVRETMSKMMKINNIDDYVVEGRIKSLYSTYLKAKRKGFERVKDRVGIRILTNDVASCYTILGLLHSKYKYMPDEFDDYISSPKPNGYRSIQTTLNWKDRLTVEVQIKTYEMHEFNEFGPASHIAYKMGKEMHGGKGLEWVRDLIKWQTNENKINNYKLHVLSKYIYVFTPKGDTIQLPAGSTVLDFAYRIHTDIGDKCSGAKVNNKMAKIDDVLKTGDIIEILVTKKLHVTKNWLSIVRTSWAKEHIRKVSQKD
jgi:GTP pyrophosphokinase